MGAMDFKRWFWTDDTPRWERRVTTLLWMATLAMLLALMIFVFGYY